MNVEAVHGIGGLLTPETFQKRLLDSVLDAWLLRCRRQHVMPEPQPISPGDSFQGVLERGASRMRVGAARPAGQWCAPAGLSGSGDWKGAIVIRKPLERSDRIVPSQYTRAVHSDDSGIGLP